MKTSFRYKSSWLFLLLMIGFIHCDDGLPDDPYGDIRSALNVDLSTGLSTMDVSSARANFNNFPFDALSSIEMRGIESIREEEKVAWDYYNRMNGLHGSAILGQLAGIEKSHFDSAIIPLEKYSVADPTENLRPGRFSSVSLQAHYDELVADGAASILDAMINGSKMQEASLVTIQNQLDNVANNRDLRHLYDDLRIATRNHLRVMVAQVQANGGNYSPLFLSTQEFQEIIDSGFEVGKFF